ncbi:MAG TPA: A/G-specific adenine glycosylase [Bacteroidia bacterium]
MQNVSDIIKWYKKNFRILPWRETKDPYKIWISEVILQQTQIVTGVDYYHKFILKFPHIKALASSNEETILKLWQGLGYYSRARNLHKTAKIISDSYDGTFPSNYKQLIKLPGIGDYTASAILSFAFDQPFPVLDGNVFRVLSRLYQIELPIDVPANRKVFMEILNQMISNQNPILFNNAMMELGAVICKPDNPKCDQCPVAVHCLSRKNGVHTQLPIKSKLMQKRTRYFNYVYIRYNNSFYLVQRIKKDIWQNLYELPLIESEKEILTSKDLLNGLSELITNTDTFSPFPQISLKHILTHQEIKAKFWVIKTNEKPNFLMNGCLKVTDENYTKYPIPVLISKFLLSL